MARDRGVKMTDAEVSELLKGQRTITLATIGPDRRPHLASMWFACDGCDLVLWTYAASQKARNVERDPRVAVLAEAGEDYTELRGVNLDCTARIERDPAEVLELGRLLQVRNGSVPGGSGAAAEAALAAQAAKRIGLRLSVERVRSWDHRKLTAR